MRYAWVVRFAVAYNILYPGQYSSAASNFPQMHTGVPARAALVCSDTCTHGLTGWRTPCIITTLTIVEMGSCTGMSQGRGARGFAAPHSPTPRSEEHTSELQSR